MTENEVAKKNLETLERFYRIAKSGSALHEVLSVYVTLEDLVEAIQALEKVQVFEAIGTVEELKSMKENGSFSGVELAQSTSDTLSAERRVVMADCRKCKHNYKMPGDEPRCNLMCDGESDFEPITNSMRIRSMSDEELAEFLQRFGTFNQPCSLSVGEPLKWLKSEAE